MDRKASNFTRACKKVKNLDFYAEDISLTFREKTKYATWVGTFFTIAALINFSGFAMMTTSKLISGDDPFLSSHSNPTEETYPIDLKQLGYYFAIQ